MGPLAVRRPPVHISQHPVSLPYLQRVASTPKLPIVQSSPMPRAKYGCGEYRCGVKRTDVFGLWFSGGLLLVTVGLLLVGYCQVRAYDRQRQIIDMQNEISARNYIATHRPKIRVKHMWLANDIWSGENIAPRLVITNTGTAPSRINRVSFGMTIVSSKRGLQFPPDDEPQNNAPSVPIIGAGVTWEIDAQDLSRPIAALSQKIMCGYAQGLTSFFASGRSNTNPPGAIPKMSGGTQPAIVAVCFCGRMPTLMNGPLPRPPRSRLRISGLTPGTRSTYPRSGALGAFRRRFIVCNRQILDIRST